MSDIIVNGYVYMNVEPWILDAVGPDLTFLSMFTYGISDDGHLIPLEDEAVADRVRPFGVGPLMVLTAMDANGTFDSSRVGEIFNSPVRSSQLIDEIQANILEKDLAGIDFDLEYLPAETAAGYGAFIRATRERLAPLGKYVMVAAAPKLYAAQPGLLYEGHDYALLGQAADFVFLMTYEWGYTYGPPMAVAPINQVRRVIEYGVTEIPPSKILMGIPNYGYDWTLPFVQGESRAEKIGNAEAEARAARFGAVIQWDEAAQSPYYRYYDDQGREHEVWFENQYSLLAKYQLIPEFGLAGMSIWNLMTYDPVAWELLRSMFTVTKI